MNLKNFSEHKPIYFRIFSMIAVVCLLFLIWHIGATKKEAAAEDAKIQYISEHGYSLWYPESLQAVTIYDYEGFSSKEAPSAEILIVPANNSIDFDDAYLEEASGNYRVSREYEHVTVSEIKNLTSEDEHVSIHMLEVIYDGDMKRFYIVKGEEQTLLITVSLEEDAVEAWKAVITKMIQSITFETEDSKK